MVRLPDPVRRKVALDMRFNLARVGPGSRNDCCPERDDYDTAADEMIDSAWYHLGRHQGTQACGDDADR